MSLNADVGELFDEVLVELKREAELHIAEHITVHGPRVGGLLEEVVDVYEGPVRQLVGADSPEDARILRADVGATHTLEHGGVLEEGVELGELFVRQALRGEASEVLERRFPGLGSDPFAETLRHQLALEGELELAGAARLDETEGEQGLSARELYERLVRVHEVGIPPQPERFRILLEGGDRDRLLGDGGRPGFRIEQVGHGQQHLLVELEDRHEGGWHGPWRGILCRGGRW